MAPSDIVIRGAREHNLRSVDLVLPRNQLICLTGVSGSGKSSLAFDTLFAEGQRRYVESLSNFARQFLGQMPKPDVDAITGLSPSIAIAQKSAGQNPRSTVGTITEIYDFLRVLYARTGRGHCPRCGRPMTAQSRDEILATIATLPPGTRFSVLAPLVHQQKGAFRDLFVDLTKQGFARARVDGTVVSLSDDVQLDRRMRHTVELVIDRLTARPDQRHRLAEAVETALKMGKGNLTVVPDAPADAGSVGGPGGAAARSEPPPGELFLSADYACTHCSLSFTPPSPQLFSFNSPQGMCPTCDGLGETFSFDPDELVTRPDRSLKKGCIELVGSWAELGRWRRHIYQGVADTMQRKLDLEPGTLLETPWEKLDPAHQAIWLWGTGDEHITFTWRHGAAGHKYGGQFEGIIPDLVAKYTGGKSRPQLRRLEKYMRVLGCRDCHGERLNAQARAVTLRSADASFAARPERSLPEVCRLPIAEAARFFSQLDLEGPRAVIAAEVLKEIRGRLGFLTNVGLDYLTLERTAPTLSGGESQRIRLAGQIGCGLVGVLYILDEPSIGLHPRDNDRLLATLEQLRDQGNTVVVVEHDEDTMRAADHLIDFGPGAGVRGGDVVASGRVADLSREPKSITGQYLAGRQKIERPRSVRPRGVRSLRVVGATHNNLAGIDVAIPLGNFVCVTGVSGSGKSSLVRDILVETLRRDLNGGKAQPGYYQRITGLEHLDKMIAIDQSPIGRTPRSNPGTYIKVFDDIRKLYAQLPESKRRGYRPGRFSFNVRGGRCEACEGNGANRLEMDFLADLWVTCAACDGHRFNRETLAVRFKGKSIADVLEMDVQQALVHFENIPAIRHKLQTLHDVGLDYVQIGQPSPTLSGGEAQRIKLARELVKKSTGHTLYILDEPTTGLHFADIRLLLEVLHRFVDAGNTVLVVEHNLEVIKTADWVIDLGPEGGAGGGRIVVEGTPGTVADAVQSHTGRALAAMLNGAKSAAGEGKRKRAGPRRSAATQRIEIRGASQHNLKNVDVKIPRDQLTVFCGPSGSGKSSLAMDTIYAEGQRRYVESLSSYARQFVGQMPKPRLDHIEGLSPAIAIEQRNTGHTPRSTVGTVTEIYDYLRILYARLGTPYCPDCDLPIGTQSIDDIVDKVTSHREGTKLMLLAPRQIDVGQSYATLWDELRAAGYVRVRIDGTTHLLDAVPAIDRRRRHAVAVVVDRVTARKAARSRIAESIESALAIGKGVVHVAYPKTSLNEPDWPVRVHSCHLACERCGRSFDALSPHHFSFNSALGWCPACEGLGTQTGANPAALIRDPQRSLAEGAILLWPTAENPLFADMLAAIARQTGLPIDVPFAKLSPRQRRLILYGTGDRWIDVPAAQRETGQAPAKLRFQYKGLYPALDEASRLSPALRDKLEHLVDEIECSQCGGSRLQDAAAAVRFRDRTIHQVSQLPLGDLLVACRGWKLSPREKRIAGELLREIRNRLTFLIDVGLDYLSLGRPAPTLSGGEAQRIRLASQVGSGLCGVLYVLDEPTIGLHPRDNRRLIRALRKLRDLGNTLLVVEHDRDVVGSADRLLDFGPGAGRQGGRIVAQGTPRQIAARRQSVTGPYLSGRASIAVPSHRRIASVAGGAGVVDPARRGLATGRSNKRARPPERPAVTLPGGWLEVIGARHNNLQNIDVRIPLGTLTVVTGPSGSGKSSLVEDIVYNQLARTLHRARTVPGAHDAIAGVAAINKVIRVDQRPLGNSPMSNPATYTGAFELIRALFAQLPEAKLRGYAPRRFSFNVPGGRCDACDGAGQICIEMHFLPNVWVECDACHGKRYQEETLAVRYHGRSIADVLEMPCGEAVKQFGQIPKIRRILQTLCDVGLDYVALGQPAPTLSGGEAQRVKLAAELARPDTGKTLYLLDEPTTGLHFSDLEKLLGVLHRLVDLGNTVLVIEHNLDVIKTADWLIDLGPEAGDAGGRIVAAGTPEDVVAHAAAARRLARDWKRNTGRKRAAGRAGSTDRKRSTLLRSYTGEALDAVLAAGPHRPRPVYDPRVDHRTNAGDLEIEDVGRDANMPWEEDGRRWHTQARVGRDGRPCQWDGQILDQVERRIHALGEFSPTDWNARSVVEIAAARKKDGWFFHAITGETWLLKMKFRTAKRTFHRDSLVADLALKRLNELDALPVYGNRQRARAKNIRGPWQEVQVDVHGYDEIDRPEFWSFLERAVAGFFRVVDRAEEDPTAVMPWKVLGKKWHISRKGFPPGKRIHWETEVLEDLCDLLSATAPDGEFSWHSQAVVHLTVGPDKLAWASLHTKRPAGLDLVLTGPKGRFALGRVAQLGAARELRGDANGTEQVKLRFQRRDEVASRELAQFLKEHLSAVREIDAP